MKAIPPAGATVCFRDPRTWSAWWHSSPPACGPLCRHEWEKDNKSMGNRYLRNISLVIAFVAPAPLAAQSSAQLELSLKRALEIALAPEGNARVRLANQFVRQAEARSDQARAALVLDRRHPHSGGRNKPPQRGCIFVRDQEAGSFPRLPGGCPALPHPVCRSRPTPGSGDIAPW